MRLRLIFRKIHRWVGLLASLWLMQLAITGLLLQHADDLGLSTHYVSSPMVLQWFGYGKRQLAWDSSGETWYQLDDVISFRGRTTPVTDEVIGVVKQQNHWLIATANSLYWFNQQVELVKQLDDFDGLPTPVQLVDKHQSHVVLKSQQSWYQLEADIFKRIEAIEVMKKPSSRALNPVEINTLFNTILTDKLAYDKVIHGIHSGIKSSAWLNTLSSLSLLYLCFSGIYLFFKQAKRNRR